MSSLEILVIGVGLQLCSYLVAKPQPVEEENTFYFQF